MEITKIERTAPLTGASKTLSFTVDNIYLINVSYYPGNGFESRIRFADDIGGTGTAYIYRDFSGFKDKADFEHFVEASLDGDVLEKAIAKLNKSETARFSLEVS